MSGLIGLIGRDAELAVLDALVTAAAEGKSDVLLVEGPPGIGKSALLDSLAARADGLQLLKCRGSESEFDLSYGGLSQLLLPFQELVGSLSPWQAETLGAILPGQTFAPHAVKDRFSVGAAALALLGTAAEQGPILAIVDDAHWLDNDSADALVFLARRLYREGVAIVLSRRTGEGAASLGSLPTLELEGLNLEQARQLLTRSGAAPLPPKQIKNLTVATGGNPLALLDLPRLLDADQLAGLMPAHEPPPVGVTLVEAYRGQLVAMSPSSRLATLIAAVADTSSLSLLSAALEREELTVSDLGAAEDQGLLTLSPAAGPVFRHPLVRSAVNGAATPTLRRRAHAAVAAALEAFPGTDAATSRAWHRAAAVAGLDDEVAQLLEDVAREAVGVAGFASAAVALERAAQLSSAETSRQRRYVASSEAAYHAGWSERAQQLLERGSQSPWADVDLELRATVIQSQLESSLGHPRRAYTRLAEVAERLSGSHPDGATLLWLLAVEAASFVGDMNTALEAVNCAKKLIGPNTELQELSGAALGGVLTLRGESREGMPLLLRWAQLALDALSVPDPAAQLLQMAGAVGFCLSTVDAAEQADELLTAVVTRSVGAGATGALPFALSCRATVHHRRGDWVAAQADADRGLELARDTGRDLDISGCLVINALLDATAGRKEDLEQHLSEAFPVVLQGGVATTLAQAYYMQGLFELGEGRPAFAIPPLEEMRRVCQEHGLNEMGHWQWPSDLVEAYVRAGQADEAASVLERLEWHAARTERPIVLALAARCRGLLSSSTGYEQSFQDALAWHEMAGRPFEQARTQLCFGERLRRSKQRASARVQLEAAWKTFSRLGANSWAARTMAELSATGATTNRPSEETPELRLLTPQELQVAIAVASGATNKEAASRLFLSPKTVEYHLARVYRKLEVSGRDELPGKFRERSQDRS